MRLYLVRHGIAVDRGSGVDDARRELTPDGEEKTRRSVRGLRRLVSAPSAVLTSPLLRARQTAQIVAEVLGVTRIVETAALLPGAEPGELLAELARLDDEEVLAVGHQPHLDLFIASALGRHRPLTNLKKAGAACLDLEDDGDPAILVWLLPPAVLRRIP